MCSRDCKSSARLNLNVSARARLKDFKESNTSHQHELFEGKKKKIKKKLTIS